jgi:hypothetical protein
MNPLLVRAAPHSKPGSIEVTTCLAEHYRPSDGLLAAFGSLPPQLLNPGRSSHDAPVKQEDVGEWVVRANGTS